MGNRSQRRTRLVATAAVLLSAAAVAVGCGSSAYARRTAEDQRLSARVEERLAAMSALARARVEARAHWGVVALLGEVPDEQWKHAAEQLAATIPGVVRVNNLILVVKGASQAEGSPPPAGSLLIARIE
jgi:osmotically-inducible protein OsmY